MSRSCAVFLALLVAGPGLYAPARGQAFVNLGPNPQAFGFGVMEAPRVAHHVDLNGDGAVDAVQGAAGLGFVAWFARGQGTGRFSAAETLALPPLGVQTDYLGAEGLTPLDLDRDGDLDLVTGYYRRFPYAQVGPGPLIAYLNDGRGNFTGELTGRFEPYALHPLRIDAVDLNRDGHPDLVVGRYDPRFGMDIHAFLDNGSGYFTHLSNNFPTLPNSVYEFAAADFDHDGDQDLVVTTIGGGTNIFTWTNDGTGYFQSGFGFPSYWCEFLETGDINRDGHADIVIAGARLALQVWLGDGTGGFTQANNAFPFAWRGTDNHRNSLQLADLDGNGALDIVTAKIDVGLEIYLNDGAGVFRDGRAELGFGSYSNPRIAFADDLDRDGDVDLQFNLPADWWANLERQILTNDPPIGGTLNVDLFARPQHIASYLIGFARRDLFIPGIGWSALDPATAVAWPSAVTMGPSGRFRTTLGVPNDQSLRGLRLFAQGVDLDPLAGLRPTNVWPFTIQ